MSSPNLAQALVSAGMKKEVLEPASQCAPHTALSLNELRNGCGVQFEDYDMNGEQSATTTVLLPNTTEKSFRTTNLMHSEMMAINWMIDKGHWVVSGDGRVVWADGKAITRDQFKTAQPHCGFCTVFLIAAGLPVTKPTRGNFQVAARLAYQLPVELEVSAALLARMAGGFAVLKHLLNGLKGDRAWVLRVGGQCYDENGLAQVPFGVTIVDWSTLENEPKRNTIYQLWKVVYWQILETNRGK